MSNQAYKTIDKFDQVLGSLEGLPDVTKTKPRTVRGTLPLTGESQTFIIETRRLREHGDYVFLEYVDSAGMVRLVLPPTASETIARQRESLNKAVRRQAGKAQAAARKARGEVPGFMKNGRRPVAAGGTEEAE